MPTKIEANLESAPQINVVSTPPSSDTSLAREFAIKGVGVAADAVADHFNRTNLRNAEADIDAAAQGALQTGLESARKQEALLQQMLSADEQVVDRARAELDELRLAREQGLMMGPEREMRVNQLVKWYANQYPHLAPQFRQMGSAANENVAGALRASAGDDPVQKGRDNLIAEATERNMRPYEVIQEKNLLAHYTLLEKRASALAFSRDARKEDIFIALQDQLGGFLHMRGAGLARELRDIVGASGKTHTDEVMARLENARNLDKQQFLRTRNQYQVESGVSLTVEQANAIDRQIDAFYDSMKVQIGVLPTAEALTKWAQAQYELRLATTQERFAVAAGGNLPAILAAKSPEAMISYINTGMATKVRMDRILAGNNGDRKRAAEAYYARHQHDPEALVFFQMAESGELDTIMGAAMGDLWSKGTEPNSSVPYVNHQAKQYTLDMYERETWQARKTATPNLVNGLSFNEINESPVLLSDIRVNPQAVAGYVEKATLQAMDYIGTPGTRSEMQIDYGNYNMPLSYKYGVSGGKGVSNIQNANAIYRSIRDNVGIESARSWLQSLQDMGVTTVGAQSFGEAPRDAFGRDRAGGPAPRSLREAAAARNPDRPESGRPLYEAMLQEADALGVPRWMAAAFMRHESSDATNLVGPATRTGERASGPLMIMPGTFEGVNQQAFGGNLSIASNYDKGVASLVHLRDLIQKYGVDNLSKIAGEYHGGPDWSPTKTDGQQTTGDYIAEITRLAQELQEIEKSTE